MLAGLIAQRFGAGIGGLFLAFPAIFPSTATLIAAHEKRQVAHTGRSGNRKARELAGADAVGASMGALGLMAFAAIVWWAIVSYSTVLTLSMATSAWGLVSFAIWGAWKSGRRLLGDRLRRTDIPYRKRHCASVHRRKSHE